METCESYGVGSAAAEVAEYAGATAVRALNEDAARTIRKVVCSPSDNRSLFDQSAARKVEGELVSKSKT